MKSIHPIRSLILLGALIVMTLFTAIAQPEILAALPLFAVGGHVLNPRHVPDPLLKAFKWIKRMSKRHKMKAMAVLTVIGAAIFQTPLAFGELIIDHHTQLTVTSLSNIAARTATVTGASSDLQGFLGIIKVSQLVGTVSGTSPTLDGKIQDSADGSTGWADVSGATFAQVTASDSYTHIGVDTRVAKRFIRYVGTIAGTSPSFTMGIFFTGEKQYQ